MSCLIFTGIILTIAKNISQERSVSSIYHLLVGSKNIQTIQDAYIFGIQNYYGVYKGLEKSRFDEKIQELTQLGLLIEKARENSRKFMAYTEQADYWLSEHQQRLPLHYFQGIVYEEKASLFYERLLLLIQTLSNVKENNFNFIPVIHQSDAESFVRNVYNQKKANKNQYIQKLYEELVDLLEDLPEVEANLFVDRLSGFGHYGKSIEQLETTYNKSKDDVILTLVGVSHQFIRKIESEKNTYHVLFEMVADLQTPSRLTDSARKTYELFLRDFTPEEIAHKRHLKLNTIYDHLAEIALYDSAFPFSSFVTETEAEEIMHAIEHTESYKLKVIKDAVPSDISFFQIRLMLVFKHKFREGGGQFV
ncbi:helix-turn-helix domain-containing protein [Oceanobacillus luteolus]|uniref:Helix-turn-helix domain-containing protein n=1 Tax=Oceanobacillus luteolus TaxID=1274358 RepID=A0ABW4HRW0_9BACI